MSFPFLKTTAPPIGPAQTNRPQLPMPMLIVVGCRAEPWRMGEGAFYPPDVVRWLGRGKPETIGDFSSFDPHRPGDPFPPQLGISACLRGEGLSREQAKLVGKGVHIEIENVGVCPMYVNGVRMKKGIVRPDDTVMFENEVLFICVLRMPEFPALRHTSIGHAFGGPDAYRIAGESPETWQLRDDASYVALGSDDLVIEGETGSGKTAIADMVHALSSRALGPLVPTNGGHLEKGILPLLLFGKVANVPNPGPAVKGLFPSAEGGSLFLDEVHLLSHNGQGGFLTALEKGWYTVLGESNPRRVDVRVIAATNAGREALKKDFQYRFPETLRIPPLRKRREDISLILRELLRQRLKNDGRLSPFFVKGPAGDLHPRISLWLLDFLVRHELPGNARELTLLVLPAIRHSKGDQIEMLPDGSPELSGIYDDSVLDGPAPSTQPEASGRRSSVPSSPPVSGPRSAPPSTEREMESGEVAPTKERIAEAYVRAGGMHTKAAKLLGVERSRLYRIMEGLGMKASKK